MKYNHKVICDLCGLEFRRSEVIRITDKYNHNYGLVVCKYEKEKTNPQNYPDQPWKESIVNPLYVRPEQADVYVTATTVAEIENGDIVANIGITASKPLYLSKSSQTTGSVWLSWYSPEYMGNGRLLGWRIQRESPIGGGFSTLISNTNSVDLMYNDLTITSGTSYNYKVAALTSSGVGAYSDTFSITT